MKRIDFFVAGIQKSGTTALDAHLRKHPSIQMARRKEPHFFDDESIDWSLPDYEGLHRHFDWTGNLPLLRGEATPIYIYWPHSLARMKRYHPGAKIILSLRHPGHRAYSQWRMECARGLEEMSFEQAISRRGRDRVASAEGGVHRVFSYMERGVYAAQIKRLLDLFPRTQAHFVRTDQLWETPSSALGSVFDFLGVESQAVEKPSSYVTPLASSDWSHTPAAALQAIGHFFVCDIAETAALTGLDLSDWLHAAYCEPMAP